METPPGLPSRYTLLSHLGRGAAGSVWRAHDARLARDVAIKIVTLAHPGSPASLSRFRREVDAAASIEDRHVVRTYDAGCSGSNAWIVMELLPGASVADLLADEGTLPWDRGLALAEDVARGLAAAHAAGVVHRDIKPGNVVLRGDDAVIVDFGIARLAADADATKTATGTVTGTAAYLAPEQARGDTVTAATDLYSLGCLLMTVFTGASPFTGEHAVAQALAHIGTPPPRLSDRRPDAPPALDALVARLLEKDPALRPDARTTAEELAAIRRDPATTSSLPPAPDADATLPLAAVLPAALPAALPASPTPASPPRRAAAGPSAATRSRRRWLAIPAGILLLVFGAVGGLLVGDQLPQPGTTATPRTPSSASPAGSGSATGSAAGSATGTATGSTTVTSDPGAPSASASDTPEATSPAPLPSDPVPAPTSATKAPAAPVPAGALNQVAAVISGVENPGARSQLGRAWDEATTGRTAANAGGRVATFTASLANTPQLTASERRALESALQRVLAGAG